MASAEALRAARKGAFGRSEEAPLWERDVSGEAGDEG